MLPIPDITTSIKVSVAATQVGFASTMLPNHQDIWMFVSSTNCWIKQANPSGTITCVAKASMADTDYVTINDGVAAAVIYEFDTVGDGVTGGRIQVDISGATTAASVAVILKAAIEANQTNLTVTHNGSGVLTLAATTRNITVTENVADAGFLVTFGPQASAASGSMFVPALHPVYLDGKNGSNLSVIRNTADGDAVLTRVLTF